VPQLRLSKFQIFEEKKIHKNGGMRAEKQARSRPQRLRATSRRETASRRLSHRQHAR